jgi:ESS family glutamate:Na+ symporter
MACLIEVAYEGGHGSAAAMGPTYERLGLEGAQALGLAMATVGLLVSTVVGGLLVVLGRARRWLKFPDALPIEEAMAIVEGETPPLQEVSIDLPLEEGTVEVPAVWRQLADWAVNLGLAGVAVLFGCGALAALRVVADASGGVFALVIDALPVFPLALVGSLLVRLILEKTGQTQWVSTAIQGRTGTISADLLITAATACLDLSLLAHDWIPLTVLAVVGLHSAMAGQIGLAALTEERDTPQRDGAAVGHDYAPARGRLPLGSPIAGGGGVTGVSGLSGAAVRGRSCVM